MFYEIVIAPSYTPEGLEVLKGKSKNLRILEAKARPPSGLSLRQVCAGVLGIPWLADSSQHRVQGSDESEAQKLGHHLGVCVCNLSASLCA